MTNQYKLIIILLLSIATLNAQQQSNFIFFEQNMSLFNPAFTGTEGSVAALSYRSVWSGIDGAPRVASFNYQTNQIKKASLGFSYLSDKVYIENQGIVAVDYNYNITVGTTTNLYLGIKAGLLYNSLDLMALNRITQEINPSLNSIQNYTNPLIGAGLLLKSDKYILGISTPNLLDSKRFKEQEGLITSATDKIHFYAIAGYNFDLNSNLCISPSLLYRIVNNAPNQISTLAKFTFKEKFSLGIGVSNNDYISTMFQVKINRIDIGFGYEIGQRTSQALRANSSELLIRYRL